MAESSIKSKLVPTYMMTGPYNATNFSSTVVTITDNTERRAPVVNTDSYSVFQPIISPKGVTNEAMYFEGQDVLNKYIKTFGKPNTVLYGPMATYAYQAVRGGFNLGVVNVRPIDATYPNFFVNFLIQKAKAVDGKEALKQVIYIGKNDKFDPGVSGDQKRKPGTKYGYTFAIKPFDWDEKQDAEKIKALKESLINNPNEIGTKIEEVTIDTVYDFGFKYFNLGGVTMNNTLQVGKHVNINTNFEELLTTEAVYEDRDQRTKLSKDTIGVKTSFLKTADLICSLPVFGMVYRGAGEYGNIFTATFSTKSSPLPVNRAYPYFRCAIKENAFVSEHEFDFTLFDIGEEHFNYNFRDRANNACEIRFSETNSTKTFAPYLISRKNANSIEKGIKELAKDIKADVAKQIKAKIAELDATTPETFDALDEDTKIQYQQAITAELDLLVEDFSRNQQDQIARTRETPFSRIAPWDLNPLNEDTQKFKRGQIPGIRLLNLPTVLKFDGGDNGCIKTIMGEEEFDWEAVVPDPTKIGDEAEQEKRKPTYQVWKDLFKKAYTGEIDDCIFDQTVIKDSICFGDGYPFELQQVIANLCRYKENIVHCEKTRPDFTYWRTPEASVRTMEDALNWAKMILKANPIKNVTMKPTVGSWIYTDPVTGGSYRFAGPYEYLGENSTLFNYLVSGTSDSFASNDTSVIFGGEDGTQECIPRTSQQKSDLAKCDVMYYTRRSTGRYALGEDTGYNPGMLSALKSIGTTIHFNRILNAATNVMVDNRITNTDKDSLDRLKKKIERAISPFIKHFLGKVSVSLQVSDHINEQDDPVVLAEISVEGHNYSRKNRINMIMDSSSAK